jgi:hypothetical protein
LPETWRSFFKPLLANMPEFKRAKPTEDPVPARERHRDLRRADECGIDAYQPGRPGYVVELKKKYRNRLPWATSTCGRADRRPQPERDVLRRLNAAKGGGYIPMSDHSVPDNVPVENYDYYMELLGRYGQYPLRLGKHGLPVV